MGFGQIFAGFVFLFNPNLNIMDILPDFIGYVLIVRGLGKLRDLAPSLDDARRSFLKLFYIDLAKFTLLLLLPFFTDEGFILVFTFVFTLAEVAFLLTGFINFFDGMLFLATRFDSNVMIHYIGNAKIVTLLFVYFKGIFTLLPEFIYLYVTEDVGYMLVAYKPVLNIICIFVVLVTGIVWLIHMRLFTNSVKRDVQFLANMKSYYQSDVATNTNLFFLRKIKLGMGLLGAGLLLMPDFYLDGVNGLPDALGAALILVGLLILQKHWKSMYAAIAVAVGFIAVSAVEWFMTRDFAGKFYYFGIRRSPEAYDAYLVNIGLILAETALFIALLAAITMLLKSFIDSYTGHEGESAFKSIRDKDAYMKRGLHIQCRVFFITGVIFAVSNAANFILLYLNSMYWVTNLAVCVFWLIVAMRMLFSLHDQIENRYV